MFILTRQQEAVRESKHHNPLSRCSHYLRRWTQNSYKFGTFAFM